jgi:hypothetical protein
VNFRDPALVTAVHALERRPGPESEVDVMRRIHRQQVAADRARARESRRALRHGVHGIVRPAFAVWAVVDPRR